MASSVHDVWHLIVMPDCLRVRDEVPRKKTYAWFPTCEHMFRGYMRKKGEDLLDGRTRIAIVPGSAKWNNL